MALKKKKKAIKRKAPAKKKKAIKRKIVRKAKPKSRPKPKIKKKVVAKKVKIKGKGKAQPKAKPRPKDAIGDVTHYFPHVRAAVIKLTTGLAIGDAIKIKGHTTDFVQKITSMQIDRVPITQAKKGDEIGLQVNSRVRKKDLVFKA
jgi:hypothetical protein